MGQYPIEHCFAPEVGAGTTLLVLGSLPGTVSLAEQRYYAHPRNQFWRLMETVIGDDLQPLDYPGRLDRLFEYGIGLWDTVAAARRPGSLDADIRLHAASDLIGLIEGLPQLRAIAFNGGTSARIGRGQLGESHGCALIDLPSSSPAYTLGFAAKASAWQALAPHLRRPAQRSKAKQGG